MAADLLVDGHCNIDTSAFSIYRFNSNQHYIIDKNHLH